VLPRVAYEGFRLIAFETRAIGTPVGGTPVRATPELLVTVNPPLVARAADPQSLALVHFDRNEISAVGRKCAPKLLGASSHDGHRTA
jgi:hypothetical protein